MDVKGEALLPLLTKSKLRNGTKSFLEPKFFLFIVNFKKLGFSAPLTLRPSSYVVTTDMWTRDPPISFF